MHVRTGTALTNHIIVFLLHLLSVSMAVSGECILVRLSCPSHLCVSLFLFLVCLIVCLFVWAFVSVQCVQKVSSLGCSAKHKWEELMAQSALDSTGDLFEVGI